jgi:hypothetical protein
MPGYKREDYKGISQGREGRGLALVLCQVIMGRF